MTRTRFGPDLPIRQRTGRPQVPVMPPQRLHWSLLCGKQMEAYRIVVALSDANVRLWNSLPHRVTSVAVWRSGNVVGAALQRRYSTSDPVDTGMGDRLRMGKPPQYFTKPLRPTHGTGNEYQSKCSDALRLGSKGRRGSCDLWINVWVTGKTVMPR